VRRSRDQLILGAAGIEVVAGTAVFLASSGFGGGLLAVCYGVIAAAVPIAWWVVGATIVLRARVHRIGWLLTLAAALWAVILAGFPVIAAGPAALTSPAAIWTLLAVGAAYGPSFVALILAAMVLFPDGHLPGRRWRVPVGITVAMVGVGTAAWLLRPGPFGPGMADNPMGIQPLPADAMTSLFALDSIGIALLGLIGAASIIVRYLHADAEVRAQLKWLIVSVVPIAVITPISFSEADQSTTSLPDLLDAIALLLVPVAIGIAVLRYRLYEIDRLISRTIGWAVVTGVLATVFAGGVLALQALLAGFTQGQTLAVAASTLVAFALFQPVRRRVQKAVDHRFDRARYDGERTAAAFGDRLRVELDLADLEADIAETIQVALRPSSTGVWIRTRRREATP
jgi:hypothetical protein